MIIIVPAGVVSASIFFSFLLAHEFAALDRTSYAVRFGFLDPLTAMEGILFIYNKCDEFSSRALCCQGRLSIRLGS